MFCWHGSKNWLDLRKLWLLRFLSYAEFNLFCIKRIHVLNYDCYQFYLCRFQHAFPSLFLQIFYSSQCEFREIRLDLTRTPFSPLFLSTCILVQHRMKFFYFLFVHLTGLLQNMIGKEHWSVYVPEWILILFYSFIIPVVKNLLFLFCNLVSTSGLCMWAKLTPSPFPKHPLYPPVYTSSFESIQGALWKETRHLGFKIFVYLCDERTVYDVTEWAACQNLDWLEANSCRLLCKVKRGGRGGQQRQQHSTG